MRKAEGRGGFSLSIAGGSRAKDHTKSSKPPRVCPGPFRPSLITAEISEEKLVFSSGPLFEYISTVGSIYSRDHAVSQPITMGPRRSGSFPGGEANNILSPRSETSGLGVKMVEYVLGTSPTSKDLEPRMRALVLTDGGEKKDKDKAPSSPYEAGAKKDMENGVTQNGVQNGLDDDKGFK
ncbi:unnamed protein product [Nesidiocoris tenuis]|uniref:Uncharacterized protein n=1 Tax=Nesidiocoris tenuis TaxID=355587 RepID=A0A6H5H963_9HEMI|nr:unnamed protein product [Nesidiocoris tenuis]CAB0010087.1 unnamed protein product [Nesidiocoris tenuis]